MRERKLEAQETLRIPWKKKKEKSHGGYYKTLTSSLSHTPPQKE
jgi:hypothetical protein